MGFEYLQPVKECEDIDRILRPLTNKSEGCKEREDLEVSRLQKVDCSIGMKYLHYSKAWGDSCGDCVEKGLQEVAKVAICDQFEGLKTL